MRSEVDGESEKRITRSGAWPVQFRSQAFPSGGNLRCFSGKRSGQPAPDRAALKASSLRRVFVSSQQKFIGPCQIEGYVICSDMNLRNRTCLSVTPPLFYFPCLCCAQMKIVAIIPEIYDGLYLSELICKKCCTPHSLLLRKDGDDWLASFTRATRRYPNDHYDEPQSFGLNPRRKVSLRDVEEEERPFSGYGRVLIYRRRRLSIKNRRIVWNRCRGKCHLCGKPWEFEQFGRNGWHLDHDIPNSGGGKATESLENFRVACGCCNLSKGNGRPSALIKAALGQLLNRLDPRK